MQSIRFCFIDDFENVPSKDIPCTVYEIQQQVGL